MTSKTSSIPQPIAVSTSQGWDNDGSGQWSTFAVQVGTPSQTSRVIISTASDATWVVLSQGCPSQYGSNCASNRGGLFGSANSTSWIDIGLFELDLELNLGYSGNGLYGYDTVTLGYPNSGGPQLKKQIVAGMAVMDFWLGSFGLDPAPNNFTNLNDPQPSFISSLVNQSLIPSTSWGYTAGAAYRYNKVQGSLTLGGYDSSRISSKNVTFSMYPDVARRFVANLRSITYTPTGVLATSSTTTTLMSSSISMYIDSTVPYIYLPTAICDNFAAAFGLQYNSTSELYLINSTMHTALLSMNPNITFTLANTGGQTLDIVFPYAAFDLTASYPVLPSDSNSTTYFPIKRADNDTQFTLGRVFLQEAYLTADYDRSEFTVSPCVWPSTFTQDLHAIYQPNSTTVITPTKKAGSVSVGAIAGGVVGGIAVLIAALLLFWFCYWRPRKRKAAFELAAIAAENSSQNNKTHPETSELDPTSAAYAELSAYEEAEKKRRAEAEIGGTPILRHEIDSRTPVGSELGANEIYEMPAREPVGSEMATPVPSPLGSPRAMYKEGGLERGNETESSPMLSISSGWVTPRSPLSRGASLLRQDGEEGSANKNPSVGGQAGYR